MKNSYYTVERNAQIVIALLKAKGIKKVVASPGTTNIAIVGSMMHDPYFEMYSAPDERSAAYIACGLSAESNEAVVLSCTGATASRNYFPALTEAYYRKLPIIAITSALPLSRSGHLQPQFCDRSQQPVDTIKLSVQIPIVQDSLSEWECITKVNQALLEAFRFGGGPVHLNLTTSSELYNFSVKQLPDVRNIERHYKVQGSYDLHRKRVAVFIGSHKNFTEAETCAIDTFCSKYNSVVFADHTSGYYGKYRAQYSIVAAQNIADDNLCPDVLIHIGEVSGDYYTLGKLGQAKEVWRVSVDGDLKDYFKKVTKVFQMSEEIFFTEISRCDLVGDDSYLENCVNQIDLVRSKIGDLPLSNIWMSSVLSKLLPNNSVVHFGILNSLRAWNFFDLPSGVKAYCNVGGFGIDGILSTTIGASLVNPTKPYYCVVGDLAFFYDLNSLGNRHVGKNLRILVINNGKGTEFRNHTHPGSKFGDEADLFIAAGGHYGNKSGELLRHYSEDLGFRYLCANTKAEFMSSIHEFVTSSLDKSIIFEAFTDNISEDKALYDILNLIEDKAYSKFSNFKRSVKNVLGDDLTKSLKNIIK